MFYFKHLYLKLSQFIIMYNVVLFNLNILSKASNKCQYLMQKNQDFYKKILNN